MKNKKTSELMLPKAKKGHILLFFMCFLLFSSTWAARAISNPDTKPAFLVSGSVKDAEGMPLPGVNIVEDGTTNGTITDFDGRYTLEVADENAVLVFSFMGYQTKTVKVNGRSPIDITLQESTEEIEEVVVTALGIEREKKALGYAVSEVSGDELAKVRENNIVNSLSGKAAGVLISKSATGPGGSSRVIIRGCNSLKGNNQPLFVVDGIPIDNRSNGGGGEYGGTDYGNGIADINPDDIETISVLKGANAAALYGSRAANGVILVTTKKGAEKKGIGISFNSNIQFETPLILPDFQNEYGQGLSGFDFVPSSVTGVDSIPAGMEASWGPKMDGRQIRTFAGETRTFSPQPNNIQNFFQTGVTASNSIALSGGSENGTIRLSYSNMYNEGIVPNSEIMKHSINFRGIANITEKLQVDAKINYINQKAENRPQLAASPDNPVRALILMPRSIYLDDLKDYRNEYGEPILWNGKISGLFQNPYWTVNLNTNQDKKDRIIGFISLKYDVTDWLNLTLRSGTDLSFDRRESRFATNTCYKVTEDGAEYHLSNVKVRQFNSDFLLNASKDFDKLSGSISVGGNFFKTQNEIIGFAGYGLNEPNFFYIENAVEQKPSYGFSEKQIQSLYAFGQIGYNNYLYLDITARNDWSSTLPLENCSYFYPSASVSFIATEAFDLDMIKADFLKLRASWAQVGNDTDPYRLENAYIMNLGYNGQPFAYINPTLAIYDLKPEITTSYEFGIDGRFVNNRFGIDLTYYNSATKNQILKAQVTATTGHLYKMINAGRIENKGVELMFRATPVKLSFGFQWDISFNYSKNTSEVAELYEGVELLTLHDQNYQSAPIEIVAQVGRPYGDILGYKYLRDESGNRVINENGLPMMMTDDNGKPLLELVGNYQPDWLGGISNTFSYKNISLRFLIDIRQGGDIFSFTQVEAARFGNTKETLEGREEWIAEETARKEAEVSPIKWYYGNHGGGYVSEGVTEDGSVNEKYINPQNYWAYIAAGKNAITEEFIYDGSYIKLRELSISYSLPRSVLDKTPFRRLEIAAVGRNLHFFSKNTEGFDPESNFNSGNAQGFEYFGYPSTRSFGFNLKIDF